MRVAKMPYLQLVRGKYRVRMVVPPELQPIIGKANLTKWLGTGNEPEATDCQCRGSPRIRRGSTRQRDVTPYSAASIC